LIAVYGECGTANGIVCQNYGEKMMRNNKKSSKPFLVPLKILGNFRLKNKI